MSNRVVGREKLDTPLTLVTTKSMSGRIKAAAARLQVPNAFVVRWAIEAWLRKNEPADQETGDR